jgi:hypothetical protein
MVRSRQRVHGAGWFSGSVEALSVGILIGLSNLLKPFNFMTKD